MTPSNNIDTEQVELGYIDDGGASRHYFLYKKKAMPVEWADIAVPCLKADRDKLIKHLAFYYGLPEAEMRKVAEGVK